MLITFFLHQYRLTTAVCTWRCAQGCHCSFGVSQPTTYYSEAQKNFNFQDSWNSLIRDFCMQHTLCVEITWPKKNCSVILSIRFFQEPYIFGNCQFFSCPDIFHIFPQCGSSKQENSPKKYRHPLFLATRFQAQKSRIQREKLV